MFCLGEFESSAGIKLDWKIEMEGLSYRDWECLAWVASLVVPPFSEVEGVPRGGLELARELRPYARGDGLLIVDDVMTTGASMERQRGDRAAHGLVVFNRGSSTPHWVRPLFSLNQTNDVGAAKEAIVEAAARGLFVSEGWDNRAGCRRVAYADDGTLLDAISRYLDLVRSDVPEGDEGEGPGDGGGPA